MNLKELSKIIDSASNKVIYRVNYKDPTTGKAKVEEFEGTEEEARGAAEDFADNFKKGSYTIKRVKDSVELEEGVNIVYGAPGGGFPSFGKVSHMVDVDTYKALQDEYDEKYHQEAVDYFDKEQGNSTDFFEDLLGVDSMYSEVKEECCAFLSTVYPEEEMDFVEWMFTSKTGKGVFYCGLMGV